MKKLGIGCLALIGAVVAVFVIIGVIAAVSGGGSDSGSNDTATSEDTATATASGEASPSQEATKAAPKPQPKAVKVRASKILKEFEDNEAAADAKYKGKNLRVTGVVDKVDTELIDEEQYVIQVGGGGDFEFTTVNCDDQPSSVAAKVNKGDRVVVVGEFEDGGDLGVELKDCKLVK